MLLMDAAERRKLIGARLKALRNAKGLSQPALSRLSGVPQSSIVRYERGQSEPLATAAAALAKALGTTVEELLSDMDPADDPPAAEPE